MVAGLARDLLSKGNARGRILSNAQYKDNTYKCLEGIEGAALSYLYEIQDDDWGAFEEEWHTGVDYCGSVCLDCGLCGCSNCGENICNPGRAGRLGPEFEKQLRWWRSRAFGTDNRMRAFTVKRLF